MLVTKLVPAGSSYVKIPCSKRAAMRVLLETVQRGSRNWISGEVPAHKALGFAEKVTERYRADASQGQRAYAKSRGRANTTLVMYPEDRASLRYWLLASPGEGAVHVQERMQDAHASRSLLMWADQYELAHVQHPKAHGGGRRWTWRLSDARYAELEASMCRFAASPGYGRERTDDLDALVQALMRMPGFYGVRHQQIALLSLGRKVWRKSHSRDRTYPWPEHVPYLDKRFACYHRPHPLQLDVWVRFAQQSEDALTRLETLLEDQA